MQKLKKSISLSKGLALAIGSIMGSGIPFFLPSLTYGISSNDVVLVWVLATVICLPLLLVFTDMVAAVPNESELKKPSSLRKNHKTINTHLNPDQIFHFLENRVKFNMDQYSWTLPNLEFSKNFRV